MQIWLLAGRPNDLARNARPSAWRTRVKVWEWSFDGDDGPLAGVTLEWLAALRRARVGTPPAPLRRWLKRHTPRQMWQERAFRHEIERE